MARLRIICLASPLVWSEVRPNGLLDAMLAMGISNKSWLDMTQKIGTRSGIYKVQRLSREGFVLALFADESEVKDDFKSLERILKEDDCLPSDIDPPTQVPRATKTQLYFDLMRGICYAYSPGIASPLESIVQCLKLMESDLPMHSGGATVFSHDAGLLEKITDLAKQAGYVPYQTMADLDSVEVTAVGDLMSNNEWKKVQDSIDSGKWKTIRYTKSSAQTMDIFGLTRTRRNEIALPMDKDISPEDSLERILALSLLIEKALGTDIRQNCFPHASTTLSKYFSA